MVRGCIWMVRVFYTENLIDCMRKLWCKENLSKESLGYNFGIPRNNTYHDNFNSILINFNDEGENIVNNSDFIDANVS